MLLSAPRHVWCPDRHLHKQESEAESRSLCSQQVVIGFSIWKARHDFCSILDQLRCMAILKVACDATTGNLSIHLFQVLRPTTHESGYTILTFKDELHTTASSEIAAFARCNFYFPQIELGEERLRIDFFPNDYLLRFQLAAALHTSWRLVRCFSYCVVRPIQSSNTACRTRILFCRRYCPFASGK
jgi:hypothetical protein